MMSKKRVILGVMIFVILVISVFGVSAGIIEDLGNLFTGGTDNPDLKGELNEPHPAVLSVGDDPPIIVAVEPYITPPALNADTGAGGGTTTTADGFYLIAYDPNGVGDLPTLPAEMNIDGYVFKDSNTQENYPFPGDLDRTKRNLPVDPCTYDIDVDLGISGIYINYYTGLPFELGEFGRRYICKVTMYYYDDPDEGVPTDLWHVAIIDFKDLPTGGAPTGSLAQNIADSITDLDLDTINELEFEDVFAPGTTTALFTDSVDIDFGVIRPSDPTTWGDERPTVVIKNIGNDYFDGTSGTEEFDFTGTALIGISGDTISPTNFKVGDADGTVCASGISLVDATPVAFNLLTLNNGDHTLSSDAKKTVYFCLFQLQEAGTGLTVEPFATTIDWTISN